MAKKKIDIELNVKTKKAAQDLKTVDQGLSGIGKAGKVAGGGFKIMGTAMKAAGIGVIVALFGKLVEQLMKNQKFMDAINKIFLALEPILMAVAEVIAIVVDGLANMIGATLGAVGATNNLTEGLVEQRNAVRLLEAELGLIQLQYLREAELMRQIRDDESLSIDERIEANYELGKVLEEQLQVERSIAMESLRLAELELSRNKTNIDLQVALLEAKTKMAEIDERITGQRSEQLVNLNSLERDRKAQQKENAAKREEQLKKEADMLQNLIDLQNEDIKVKKKAAKTIGEQFDTAEEANKAQLEELERLKQAELDAVDASVRGAKKNIEAQKEVTAGYTEELEVLEDANKKKAQSVEDLVQEQLQAFYKGEGAFEDYVKGNEKFYVEGKQIQEGVLKEMRRKALKGEEGERVTTLEEYERFIAEYTAIYQDGLSKSVADFDASNLLMNNATEADVERAKKRMRETKGENVGILKANLETVQNLSKTTNDAIAETTEEQLNQSVQSAASSEQILATSADKKIAIEKKYALKIEETEKGLIDTTTTLQEQADEALFLHFETEKEKEIRLATEKYDILLGLALNNAEQTELLEQEKEDALREIREREGKERIAKMKEWWKKMAEEKKKQDKLDELAAENKKKMQIDAAQQSFAMGVGLAKKGTATYKALASAETIMATYSAATKALDDVPSPFNFVQAGLIIATGMKNLAEIGKTKVEGGGTETMTDTISGGGDMGGDVPALPTIGDVGFDAPPVQAYVIETDISNAQALQSELDLQSTL